MVECDRKRKKDRDTRYSLARTMVVINGNAWNSRGMINDSSYSRALVQSPSGSLYEDRTSSEPRLSFEIYYIHGFVGFLYPYCQYESQNIMLNEHLDPQMFVMLLTGWLLRNTWFLALYISIWIHIFLMPLLYIYLSIVIFIGTFNRFPLWFFFFFSSIFSIDLSNRTSKRMQRVKSCV